MRRQDLTSGEIVVSCEPRWRTTPPNHTEELPPINWQMTWKGRPLVVIDPDDREQVERLLSAWFSIGGRPGTNFQQVEVDKLSGALRSLIEPPRPEEPTNWLAVVESGDGQQFYRVGGEEIPAGTAAWSGRGQAWVGQVWMWADVPAARIVSEGVTPDA